RIPVDSTGGAGQRYGGKGKPAGTQAPADSDVFEHDMGYHDQHRGQQDRPYGPPEDRVPVLVEVPPVLVVADLVVYPLVDEVIAQPRHVGISQVPFWPTVPGPLDHRREPWPRDRFRRPCVEPGEAVEFQAARLSRIHERQETTDAEILSYRA